MRFELNTCIAAAAAFAIAGCGGVSTGDISGEIKYAGKPLAGATVTFYDANNKAPSAVIGEDGKYEVKKVATGVAKIAIVTPLDITFAGGGEGLPKSKTPAIPAKYADREQSGLTVDVKSGAQVKDFILP